MRQKPAPQNTFFNLKQEPQQFRPTSVATEFVDTDWDEEDDEDEVSEAEDNSPRVSLQSVGGFLSFLPVFSRSGNKTLTSGPRSLGSQVSRPSLRTTRSPHLVRVECRSSISNTLRSRLKALAAHTSSNFLPTSTRGTKQVRMMQF